MIIIDHCYPLVATTPTACGIETFSDSVGVPSHLVATTPTARGIETCQDEDCQHPH